MLSHDERAQRRVEIAEYAKKLLSEKMPRHVIVAAIAEKFKVGTSIIERSLKEGNVEFADHPKMKRTFRTERSARFLAIQELLEKSDLTYRQIAQKVGATSQYVQICHKTLLELGHDVPLRKEVMDRVRIAKEAALRAQDDKFVEKYVETNDINESAKFAGISVLRANKLLKKRKLDGKGLLIDKGLCEEYPAQRITRRLLYIVNDLFDPNLTIAEIARKWKKPGPFVCNLMAECKKAGLPMPQHADGRRIANRNPTKPGTKAAVIKTKTCTQCGSDFTVAADSNMNLIHAFNNRKRCFDCLPYVPLKKAIESKLFDGNDLKETATESKQNGLTV